MYYFLNFSQLIKNGCIIVFMMFLFMLWSNWGLAQNRFDLQVKTADSLGIKDLIQQAQLIQDRDSSRLMYLAALERSQQIDYSEGITLTLPILIKMDKEEGRRSSALRYALEALRFFEKSNQPTKAYQSLISIAEIYQEENLPTKAISFYRQAMNKINNQLTEDVLNDIRMEIAFNFANNNQQDSANFYYLKAKSYYDKKEETRGTINCLQQLSRFHTNINNYSEAIHYNMALLGHYKRLQDKGQQAIVYNNIGYNYHELKDYKNAINYFELAEKIAEENIKIDKIGLYINLAIAYSNLGNRTKANQNFNAALKLIPAKDIKRRGEVEQLLTNNYLKQGDIYNALRYNETTIDLAKRAKSDELLSRAYYTAAQIQENLYDYEIALRYYQKHLRLRDSFRLEERINQQKLLQQQQGLERAEREIRLLLVNQEVQKLTIDQLKLAEEKKSLEVKQLELDNRAKEDELRLAAQEKEVQQALLKNKELEAEQTRQQLALSKQELLSIQGAQEISKLKQREQEQQLVLQQKLAEEIQRKADITRLELEQDAAQAKLKQEASFRKFVYGVAGLTTLILFLILAGLLYFRKASQMLSYQNQQIEAQKEELEKERNVSEQLLLNILPEQTALELKTKGKATPRAYDMVSVIFTDFRNFTSIAATLDAEELIESLNKYFMAFDQILEKHGLEKIKTIGDAYMCVAGLPSPQEDHAIRAVNSALEMQRYVRENQPLQTAEGSQQWRMRLGIHSGPVVAGVVGSKKFAYDVWGDTVNVASRMESSGKESRVNISEATFQLVKDQFLCDYRGEIDVKGKGKIGMYFINKPLV